MIKSATWLAAALVLAGCGEDSAAPRDTTCDGVTCSGHGTCASVAGQPGCVCAEGYAGSDCSDCAAGLEPDSAGNCQPAATACTTQSCSGHGICTDDSGAAVCTCVIGYTGTRCDECAAGSHVVAGGACAPDPATCEDNPCGDHGTCQDAAGVVTCVCDPGFIGVACQDCAAGYHPDATLGCAPDITGCTASNQCSGDMACVGYGCVSPVSDPSAYATEAGARQASYVWAIQHPALYPTPERCCFDFTGDGEPDDALGSFLALMSSIPGPDVDLQALMDDAIDEGSLVRVLDWTSLPPLLADGPARLSVFDAILTGGAVPSLADRKAGLGHVLLEEESFGQYGAQSQLNDAAIADAVFTGRGNVLTLPVQIFSRPYSLSFVDVRMEGELMVGEEGQPCRGVCSVDEVRGTGEEAYLAAGMRVGGLIEANELLTAMDEDFRQCACAGIDPAQPVLQWQIDSSEGAMVISCTDNTGTPSSCEPDDHCQQIDTLCGFVGFWGAVFDVDRDDDGINESMSAGFRFGLSGVAIDGLAPGE